MRSSPESSSLGTRGRRWVLRVLLVGCAVALVVLAGLRLSSAARALNDAEAQIGIASNAIRDGRISEALSALDSAQRSIDAANADVQTSPEVAFLGLLPVVRQNLASLEDSIETAAVVVHGGRRILGSARDLEADDGTLQVSLSDGTLPIDEVARAQTEIAALRVQLPTRMPEASRLLLPAMRDVRTKVFDEAIRRRADLDRLDRGLTLLDELAGGERPRRYLLAIGNTAEMRGAGGMMLNYGVLEGVDGTIDLAEFGRVEELVVGAPVDPAAVGLPDDFLRRWDGFDVTREWRNATMSADFTLMAPVLVAMYERATGLPADGVIQVDPGGLAAILDGVGPVEVPEVGRVTTDNVEALVLNEAYRLFPGIEERTDVLGNVAEAAFDRLVDGDYPSVRRLAEVVAGAVDGRHIMVFSTTRRIQPIVSSFGAAGSLPVPDTLDTAHLTVQNLSGNKLDYYLDTSMSIVGERIPGTIGSWTVQITLSNTAPADETKPQYIFGPFDESQTVGTYRGAVTLYLPTGTLLTAHDGESIRLPPSLQTEARRPLVGFIVDVPAGESRTVDLELRLPPSSPGTPYSLVLTPSPRARPTAVDVRIATGDGEATGSVVLDRAWVVAEGSDPSPITED